MVHVKKQTIFVTDVSLIQIFFFSNAHYAICTCAMCVMITTPMLACLHFADTNVYVFRVLI